MTADLQAKLDAIKAACRRAIELGNAAIEGPWKWEGTRASPDKSCYLTGQDWQRVGTCLDGFTDSNNAEFIAHSRTFSPDAAQALLTAIEELEKEWHRNNNAYYGELPFENILQSIADQWPNTL